MKTMPHTRIPPEQQFPILFLPKDAVIVYTCTNACLSNNNTSGSIINDVTDLQLEDMQRYYSVAQPVSMLWPPLSPFFFR